MADAHAPVTALPIVDTARVVGSYVFVERCMFDVLGGFAGTDTDPAAIGFFDTRAQHHAWHATLFSGQLPRLPGLDHDTLTAPASPASEVLRAVSGLSETVDRVGAVAELLLPRLVAGYRAHLDRCAPVADAPLARVLRLVLHDELDALAAAESLLAPMAAAGPGGLDECRGRLQALEAELAGIGPGLVAWPGEAPTRA